MVSSTYYSTSRGGKLFALLLDYKLLSLVVCWMALKAALGWGTMDATIVRYGVQEA